MNRLEICIFLCGIFALASAGNASGPSAPRIEPEPIAPAGACYAVTNEAGEILYVTGSPALGNCVDIVEDGDQPKESSKFICK